MPRHFQFVALLLMAAMAATQQCAASCSISAPQRQASAAPVSEVGMPCHQKAPAGEPEREKIPDRCANCDLIAEKASGDSFAVASLQLVALAAAPVDSRFALARATSRPPLERQRFKPSGALALRSILRV